MTEQQFRDAQRTPAQASEAFYLQAGAFQNAPDADNLKARLALIGVAAAVQTTTLPDKGVWHRVRVGPYTAIEDLNRAREVAETKRHRNHSNQSSRNTGATCQVTRETS